jgi:hypothetical protein
MVPAKSFVGACAALLSAAAVTLIMLSAPSTAGPAPGVQRAADGCGAAAYRAADGSCQPILDNNKYCQPGFRAWPYMSGYRCAPY